MELPPAHMILTRPSWTAHRTTRVLAEPPRCGGFLGEVLAVGSGRLCFCPFSGQVRRDGGVVQCPPGTGTVSFLSFFPFRPHSPFLPDTSHGWSELTV